MAYYSAFEYNIQLSVATPLEVVQSIAERKNYRGIDIDRLFGAYLHQLDHVTPAVSLVPNDSGLLIRSKAISKATSSDVRELLELLAPHILNRDEVLVIHRGEDCDDVPNAHENPWGPVPDRGRISYFEWKVVRGQPVSLQQQGEPSDKFDWVS
ncbi:hypothetical protein pEaSNUABM5_00066 [Erwinia phage pEa_SNUABM_5]|uniref:Uncharacterized protein n=1 Tax=Erwinia phage pEa_SNUABM_5 TaxID=2797313 RepID=A0A7T8EPC6_9CAUD|nr:hypothetical protein MPK73_gp066 [Erwinia phage pEa_SNUABM_5]QQO90208.1 hypothetical protein pEaSNUABM5_00066 [Erwinia phage pEa_SNUABM_5]